MNYCLSRKMLFHLYAGDGTAPQKDHLRQCWRCARRYEQLSQYLMEAEQVLRQPPPSSLPVQIPLLRLIHDYRVPVVAAALVTALLIAWGNLWFRTSVPTMPLDVQNAEVLHFFEKEVSPAVFATRDITGQLAPSPVSDAAYLEAALTDSWPCERRRSFHVPECEIYPFPLPVKEQ